MQNQPYEFTKLIRCWQSMPRAERQAPKKSSFSPARLSTIMPYLFLLEKQPDDLFRVRLMGNELETTLKAAGRASSKRRSSRSVIGHYGSDSIFAAMMDTGWQSYSRFMDNCAAQNCGGRLNRKIKRSDGTFCEIESLHVPLADADGVPRFMLGVMLLHSGASGAPATTASSPKEAILNHQYVDLGCGVPPRAAKARPAGKAIKVGVGPKRAVSAVAAVPVKQQAEETVSTYIN